MKKVCPSCGRNRRLDKKYYNNRSRPNKKNGECKDCQSDRNKRSKQMIRYKNLKAKRDRKWKQENKDHIKKYNADYYKKNKERIMSRRNTESILIIENPSKKKINKSSSTKKNTYDIVIDPKRKE
jgi:SRSO17 transposase